MYTIKVYSKSVYGTLRTYPADAAQAIALQTLTGAKTLEFRHLRALQDLGFTLEQVPDPTLKYGRTTVTPAQLPAPLE